MHEFNEVLYVEEFWKLQTLCKYHHCDPYGCLPVYTPGKHVEDN